MAAESSSNISTTSAQASKPTLQEQIEARKQAKLDYLHNNDKINGREPPVMGANNGGKDTGAGKGQQVTKSTSVGNIISGLLNGLGN